MPEEETDVLTAIARFLRDEASKAEGRVYRPKLPKSVESAMPQPCIVVMAGGGGSMMGATRMQADDDLLDIIVYGETEWEADQVARQAMYALRALGHKTVEGVLLHWARIAGGVKSAIDKETSWPFAIITIQVLHSIP